MIYFCQDADGYVMVTDSAKGQACHDAIRSTMGYEDSRRIAMYLNACLDFARGRRETLVAYLKEFHPGLEREYVRIEGGVARATAVPPAPAGYEEYVHAMAA